MVYLTESKQIFRVAKLAKVYPTVFGGAAHQFDRLYVLPPTHSTELTGGIPHHQSDADAEMEEPEMVQDVLLNVDTPHDHAIDQTNDVRVDVEEYQTFGHPGERDPSSRHFTRQHPQRNRSQPDRYGSVSRAMTARLMSFSTRPHDDDVGNLFTAHSLGAARHEHDARDLQDHNVHPADAEPHARHLAYECAMTPIDHAFSAATPITTSAHQVPGDGNHLIRATATAYAAHTNVVVTADEGDLSVPRSFNKAKRSPQWPRWRDAINAELTGLITQRVWTVVARWLVPANATIVRCHWIFALKRLIDGSIDKFKARLVADGSTQRSGIDFDQVFSSVVTTATIRLVLIIAAANGYNLSSFDIRQAYLQATLDRDIYITLPPGCGVIFDSAHEQQEAALVNQASDANDGIKPNAVHAGEYVCKLNKSLYGLKQAGRQWAQLLASFLLEWGFHRSPIDPCFYCYSKDSSLLWVLIYVDDGIIMDNDTVIRENFMRSLSARFPTEDKGELTWILNVAVKRDRKLNTITMSQRLYVDDLLHKFPAVQYPSLSRHFDTPMSDRADLDETDPNSGEISASEKASYMSLVGGLLWLANMTRYDIAYSTAQLSRRYTNPTSDDLKAAFRVLAYVRDTADKVLTFSPKPIAFEATADLVQVFVDSNWGHKFPCSGSMFFLQGCIFHWFSRNQKSVALSSAEAEFFGAMLATKEILFFRQLMADMGFMLGHPVQLLCDSQSAVHMVSDIASFKKAKHIRRAGEFISDLIMKEVASVRHIPGKTMLADLLTKPLDRAAFMRILRMMTRFTQNNNVEDIADVIE